METGINEITWKILHFYFFSKWGNLKYNIVEALTITFAISVKNVIPELAGEN